MRTNVPVMNMSVSPKLSLGTCLHRQLSLFSQKHVEESNLPGQVPAFSLITSRYSKRITRRNPDGSPVSKLLWD